MHSRYLLIFLNNYCEYSITPPLPQIYSLLQYEHIFLYSFDIEYIVRCLPKTRILPFFILFYYVLFCYCYIFHIYIFSLFAANASRCFFGTKGYIITVLKFSMQTSDMDNRVIMNNFTWNTKECSFNSGWLRHRFGI